MMGAGLDVRAVGQPRHEAGQGPDNRPDHPHDNPVRPYDETDVPVCGAEGSEHPERPQSALGEDREATYRNEADEEHGERVQGEHDRLGVEGIVGGHRGGGLDVRAERAGGYTRASNRTVTSVGAFTWPGHTRANSSSRLCGFSTIPTTCLAAPSWCQTEPILSRKAEATPAVTATWP